MQMSVIAFASTPHTVWRDQDEPGYFLQAYEEEERAWVVSFCPATPLIQIQDVSSCMMMMIHCLCTSRTGRKIIYVSWSVERPRRGFGAVWQCAGVKRQTHRHHLNPLSSSGLAAVKCVPVRIQYVREVCACGHRQEQSQRLLKGRPCW